MPSPPSFSENGGHRKMDLVAMNNLQRQQQQQQNPHMEQMKFLGADNDDDGEDVTSAEVCNFQDDSNRIFETELNGNFATVESEVVS